jgi:hypothetical protein
VTNQIMSLCPPEVKNIDKLRSGHGLLEKIKLWLMELYIQTRLDTKVKEGESPPDATTIRLEELENNPDMVPQAWIEKAKFPQSLFLAACCHMHNPVLVPDIACGTQNEKTVSRAQLKQTTAQEKRPASIDADTARAKKDDRMKVAKIDAEKQTNILLLQAAVGAQVLAARDAIGSKYGDPEEHRKAMLDMSKKLQMPTTVTAQDVLLAQGLDSETSDVESVGQAAKPRGGQNHRRSKSTESNASAPRFSATASNAFRAADAKDDSDGDSNARSKSTESATTGSASRVAAATATTGSAPRAAAAAMTASASRAAAAATVAATASDDSDGADTVEMKRLRMIIDTSRQPACYICDRNVARTCHVCKLRAICHLCSYTYCDNDDQTAALAICAKCKSV